MIESCQVLGRSPIDLKPDGTYLTGKRVMVTGAGGSIGSEICRYVAQWNPNGIVMVGRDESLLHAVNMDVVGALPGGKHTMVLCDIQNRFHVHRMMGTYMPDVVFHAAALKHQGMLERYPEHAWSVNVLGTRNVLAAAADHGVGRIVNVSTDKAADPVCVLGASKRIGERLASWYGYRGAVSVRFGNVLGSRGSVLDTFAWQLAHHVPLTVSSPDSCRYFITVREAARFVVYAGAVVESGNVAIMDMGAPVRILDIAQRLAAGNPFRQIKITGLTDVERLIEVRLGPGEEDSRPHHPLVTECPVPALDPSATVFDVDPDLMGKADIMIEAKR